MPISTFKLNRKLGVDSAFVTSLSDRRIEIVESREHNHPLVAICTCWVEFSNSLTNLLDDLAQNETSTEGGDIDLTKQFRDVVYRAAELFESYMKTFPNTVVISKIKPYKSKFIDFNDSVKGHKRKWGLICNSLKHNNNRLVHVGCYKNSLNIPFFGFSLLAPRGLKAYFKNRELHKGKETYQSYNANLHELIYDLLQTDQLAARLIDSIPERDVEQVASHSQEILSALLLKKILSRRLVVFPDQCRTLNGVTLSGEGIELSRLIAETPLEYSASVNLTIGPIATSYQILPEV